MFESISIEDVLNSDHNELMGNILNLIMKLLSVENAINCSVTFTPLQLNVFMHCMILTLSKSVLVTHVKNMDFLGNEHDKIKFIKHFLIDLKNEVLLELELNKNSIYIDTSQ